MRTDDNMGCGKTGFVPARPYCASAVAGGDDGVSGTGAFCDARAGGAAARGGGLRGGVGVLAGAVCGGADAVRAPGVSGSGFMMLTGGIELADGKSIRDATPAGRDGAADPNEPVDVTDPFDASATGAPARPSRDQLAALRST